MSQANIDFLLPMFGDDAGTAFVDYGPGALSVARAGALLPTTITAQSKFYGASARFPTNASGVTGHLQLIGGAAIATGQFTIRGWFRISSTATFNPLFYNRYTSSSFAYTGSSAFGIRTDGTPHRLRFYNFATSTDTVGTTDLSIDTWYHFEVSRDASNVLRIFLDGNLETSLTVTSNLGDRFFTVGGPNTNFNCNERWLQDVEGRVGECLHTDNFTPPTRLLGSISNAAAGAGKILDRNGNPVSRKLFAVAREYGAPSAFWGQSDAAGDYQILVPTGAEYSVVALAEGDPVLNDKVLRVIPA